uniref:Uncharacterized protein n=1 Tax=Anopheles atroparvus TaxID=41427 RepID=A0AAG5CNZ5_ANOAO
MLPAKKVSLYGFFTLVKTNQSRIFKIAALDKGISIELEKKNYTCVACARAHLHSYTYTHVNGIMGDSSHTMTHSNRSIRIR